MKFVQSLRSLTPQHGADDQDPEAFDDRGIRSRDHRSTVRSMRCGRGLVDWDAAARWMSGVDALRAKGPTAVGTALVFTARGKAAHRADRRPGPGTQHHTQVHPVRGDRLLHVRVCATRRRHPREFGSRLSDDRSSPVARPSDQVRRAQGGRRSARRVRRHVHVGVGARTSRAHSVEQPGFGRRRRSTRERRSTR